MFFWDHPNRVISIEYIDRWRIDGNRIYEIDYIQPPDVDFSFLYPENIVKSCYHSKVIIIRNKFFNCISMLI